MAWTGKNFDTVHFAKTGRSDSFERRPAQPVKKVNNFFDLDDDDFETFENDKDFAKMKVSIPPAADSGLGDLMGEEDLGSPWGGKAYSLKEETTNDRLKSLSWQASSKVSNQKETTNDPLKSLSWQASSKVSNQTLPESDFRPFHLRDNITAKSSASTQLKQTTQFTKTTVREEPTTSSTSFHERQVQSTTTTSIENVVRNAQSEMTNAERNKLLAEVKDLRKMVLNLRQEHRKTPQPSETVKKLMLNQPCVLELFKSLDGKLALLDEAIKIGDGNAIITVLLFTKKTVKYGIFAREISKRPVAVRHIVSFMKAHYDHDELVKLLRHLGRKEEAMMLEYRKALSISNPDAQMEAINICQRSYEGTPELADMVAVLNEHQVLLKRQMQIEAKDKRTEAEGRDPIMRLHPRSRVVSTPLISTLHYCCFYHFGKTENNLNPLNLQKDFKLTDKQFEWTAIRARARLKKWDDLQGLFTAKNWFGSNKLKSNLGFDKVVTILQRSNAPPDVLTEYLGLVEVPETRLSLATKLQCHKVAVETIVSMKDRQKLEDYRKHIERIHPIQAIISGYLQNSQIKWK